MRTKKHKRRNKCRYYTIIILVLFAIVGVSSLFINRGDKSTFKKESRLSKIKEEKKNDTDEYKTVGWIRVPNTNIDMPVIYIVGDAPFPVTKEKYAWTTNENGRFNNATRIYGHNIFNLSSIPEKSSPTFKRFEALMAYLYYDFAKENQYIQLSMNNKEYVYQIFSVGIIKHYYMSVLPIKEYTKEELKGTIELYKENSIYDYNVKVNKNDKILSLITCTRIYGASANVDFVVSAKLVEDQNSWKLSKVKKNKKYEKIEKTLKGDDFDEQITT